MKISRTKKTKAYIPKTEEEKEQVRIKEFLDMCAPSVLTFYPDYYICGSSFRSTWVVREYPTDTEEQALLRHLGDRSGVTLRVYTRHVTPAEERKIISNAASRNFWQHPKGDYCRVKLKRCHELNRTDAQGQRTIGTLCCIH